MTLAVDGSLKKKSNEYTHLGNYSQKATKHFVPQN